LGSGEEDAIVENARIAKEAAIQHGGGERDQGELDSEPQARVERFHKHKKKAPPKRCLLWS